MAALDQQLAGAVAILELVTSAQERSKTRRVLAETRRAWPGEPRDLWWKWFAEASRSIDLRAKAFDCTLDEACGLIADQAQLVCYREQAGRSDWLGVSPGSNGQLHMLRPDVRETPTLVAPRALRKVLREYLVDGVIRCVVLEPMATVHSTTAVPGASEPMTPWQRLGSLLRPEFSDIWLVVVFSFVVSLFMLATPIAVESLVNTVAFGRFLQPVLILALILLTFLGFQAAARALQTHVVEIIQRRMFARVAGDLAYRLPRVDVRAVDGVHLPEMVNRFFDVMTVQKVSAQLLMDGIGLVLSTLIGMAVLAFYHPWLLGFDLFLLAVIALIIFVIGRGAISTAIKESKHKYRMAAWLEDVARCPAAFRGEGGSDFALDHADQLIDKYLSARRDHFRIVMRQLLFALGLQAVASTVLLGLGGWLVIAGELTLGQLVAAELIVTIVVGSFAKFGKHMESLYDLLAAVDKLGALFDLPTERQDGLLSIGDADPDRVDLNDVSFAWPGHSNLIEGLSFELEPRGRAAILGEAGTGKSTLLELIAGMRTPTSGHVEVDGLDPRDLRPDVLRERVALVNGDEVFHGSIEENVHLHRQNVTTTDVRRALDGVGLLDAVLGHGGTDIELLSNGRPLSSSQRRLLCIARATVGRPALLLIDGTLDGLAQRDLDHCLNYLFDTNQPWTLILTTSREDIAERFSQTISLRGEGVLSG